MFAVEHNEPGLIIQSHSPAVSPGATLTPGNNTYGAYVQVQGALSDECYEVWININTVNVSASAKDCLVTIGLDPAGGTAYADFIVDLYASCASVYAAGAIPFGGISYVFPVRIPAGATVAAKASVNNATVGTANVQMRFKCRPTRPDLIRVGSYVKTFGSAPVSSSGTAVTPGTSAEGTYVQLGTVAAGDHLWFWQLGVGINNATISANSPFWDLAIGDGTNKRNVIVDLPVATSVQESIAYSNPGAYAQGNAGDSIYARAWSVGAPVTGHSAIAYGVGGVA
jgi:hypothetical protein